MTMELTVTDNNADLEMMLDGMLSAETAEPVAAPVEAAKEFIDILASDEMDDLNMALEIAENYNGQTSTPISSTEPTETDAKAAKAANKTTRTTRAARVAKPSVKDLSAVGPEFFVRKGTVAQIAFMEDADVQAEKVATIAAKPDQVKVQEKFENVLLSLAAGKLPSSYTMVAFNVLEAKGEVTIADLVAAYKATPKGGNSTDNLGEGTARAQAGQMGALLPALGLAERVGKSLKLVADSTIAERIRALMV